MNDINCNDFYDEETDCELTLASAVSMLFVLMCAESFDFVKTIAKKLNRKKKYK